MEQNPFNDEHQEPAAVDATPTPKAPAKPKTIDAAENASRRRRRLTGGIAVMLVFLAGFIPMWLKAGRHAGERDAALRAVKFLQLESLAAAAAVDARRGEYESARQSASHFFTALRTDLDLGPRSFLSAAQQAALRPLLAHRDSLITLLARSDPASAERLTEVYLACRKSLRSG